MSALTAQISVTNVVAILAGVLAVAVGFAFFWWSGRKVIRVLMSAFKRGRVSV